MSSWVLNTDTDSRSRFSLAMTVAGDLSVLQRLGGRRRVSSARTRAIGVSVPRGVSGL